MGRSTVSNDIRVFQSLVESAPVGMAAFHKVGDDYRAVFTNARATEKLECTDQSEWSFRDLIPSESRGSTVVFTVSFFERDASHSEVILKKKNGHHFLASVGIKRIQLEEKEFVLLSFRDVTVEKKMARDLQAKQQEIERAYSELLDQNTQLRSLDHAKDKFIALTTHELRTPLSAIMATADFLENKLYDSDEQRDEYIRTISEQGRHLMELVNDVLDFAKIRAGKMDFYVENIKLRPLLRNTAETFQHMADQMRLKVALDIEEGPEFVWADTIRFREILNNVVSNAIKYNREGGTVTIQTNSHVADGKSFARITVRDTGVGIPEEKLDGIFNEFETVGHVSRHHKGTGLGMPISRRLVESMGGRLTLSSKSGVGSEFYIDIPVEKVLDESMYRSRPDMETDLVAS